MQTQNNGDDDTIHNVDFSGGNVHLITTKESWDEKLAEAGRDGKIVIYPSILNPYEVSFVFLYLNFIK